MPRLAYCRYSPLYLQGAAVMWPLANSTVASYLIPDNIPHIAHFVFMHVTFPFCIIHITVCNKMPLPISLTRSSAIAEGPRDVSCQLKSCQLPCNSAETTCTTSPEQIEVMKLEG